ncbi:diphosphomevalonate decarboxylase-like [Lineus longissimus]|uniref:diphosphomevalonate decarboxylase-like n=1 Tax=Lineus longissimus TaxID=88925 RepID=UPI002B4D354D
MADIVRPGKDSDLCLVTCTAPVNIAVIKYWGKRDESLILPINSSLSATLDQEQLRATTTVAVSPAFKEDRIWLNDEEESIQNPRLQTVLSEVRRHARKRPHNGDSILSKMVTWKVHICSKNNFPTAAGLASSAAGYACLVASLAKLFGVEENVSYLARQGSGSACRSMFGGFVEWRKGSEPDGSDSMAVQCFPESHWPEMRILILVVSDHKKITGSTSGMQRSVETSDLIAYRAEHVVPQRMRDIKEAIAKRDFETFADITMKDSNQFHAICQDTYPPIYYMNDTSKAIVHLVHCYNDYVGSSKIAYTFDAGPNACIYSLDEHVAPFLVLLQHFFPLPNGECYITNPSDEHIHLKKNIVNKVKLEPQTGAIKYIKQTKVGPGPQVLENGPHLLGTDGMPL